MKKATVVLFIVSLLLAMFPLSRANGADGWGKFWRAKRLCIFVDPGLQATQKDLQLILQKSFEDFPIVLGKFSVSWVFDKKLPLTVHNKHCHTDQNKIENNICDHWDCIRLAFVNSSSIEVAADNQTANAKHYHGSTVIGSPPKAIGFSASYDRLAVIIDPERRTVEENATALKKAIGAGPFFFTNCALSTCIMRIKNENANATWCPIHKAAIKKWFTVPKDDISWSPEGITVYNTSLNGKGEVKVYDPGTSPPPAPPKVEAARPTLYLTPQNLNEICIFLDSTAMQMSEKEVRDQVYLALNIPRSPWIKDQVIIHFHGATSKVGAVFYERYACGTISQDELHEAYWICEHTGARLVFSGSSYEPTRKAAEKYFKALVAEKAEDPNFKINPKLFDRLKPHGGLTTTLRLSFIFQNDNPEVVIAHELGHQVLQDYHSADPNSVMYESISKGAKWLPKDLERFWLQYEGK